MKTIVATLVALLVLLQSPAAASDTIHKFIYDKCAIEYTNKQKALEKANYYTPMIRRAAAKYQLPARLVASVVWHESNFRPRCRSGAGAVGLMQVIPFPGRVKAGQSLYDPEDNLDIGCRMLKGFYLQFHCDWHRALTAYNWGPRYVSRGMYRSRYSVKVLGAL